MKFIVLSFLLAAALSTAAQTTDSVNPPVPADKDNATYKPIDTIIIGNSHEDSLRRAEAFSRNIEGLVRIQHENRSRQKKAAIIRIVVGIGFLVILVIGLMRKRRVAS